MAIRITRSFRAHNLKAKSNSDLFNSLYRTQYSCRTFKKTK